MTKEDSTRVIRSGVELILRWFAWREGEREREGWGEGVREINLHHIRHQVQYNSPVKSGLTKCDKSNICGIPIFVSNFVRNL